VFPGPLVNKQREKPGSQKCEETHWSGTPFLLIPKKVLQDMQRGHLGISLSLVKGNEKA